MWKNLSKIFFSGLITLLPLFVTIWLLFFIYNFLDGILGNIFTIVFGHHVPGLGLIAIVILILITGILSPMIIGKQMLLLGDKFIGSIPVVKSIYSSVKQVNDVFFMNKAQTSYNKACLIEYPRVGIWSVGFVTSETALEIETKAGHSEDKMVNIFIANTPTPATGFLIMMPIKDVQILDMKIDDAFKYVISGGVLKPKTK